MALSIAIRETATRLNRARQHRAEVRIDERIAVEDIGRDYTAADRAGDLAVEAHFQALYNLVDTEAEKEAV